MQINLEIRNVDYDKTVLSWNVQLEYKENLYKYLFLVEISFNSKEEGPWIKLFDDPIYAFGFIDTITQMGSVDQRCYYRIKAISIDNNTDIFYSNIECIIEERDNYLTDYITRNQKLLLNRNNGQEFLHYAKKKFGPRCKECYLEAERKSFKSKCSSCFGTTYEGGYFAPVKIALNKDPQLKGISKNQNEVVESKNASFVTSNDVILEADDLLIALKKSNQRYRVLQIIPVSLNDRTTSQRIAAEQVKMDDVVQLVPVDLNAYTLDEFNVFRRDWNTIR